MGVGGINLGNTKELGYEFWMYISHVALEGLHRNLGAQRRWSGASRKEQIVQGARYGFHSVEDV